MNCCNHHQIGSDPDLNDSILEENWNSPDLPCNKELGSFSFNLEHFTSESGPISSGLDYRTAGTGKWDGGDTANEDRWNPRLKASQFASHRFIWMLNKNQRINLYLKFDSPLHLIFIQLCKKVKII